MPTLENPADTLAPIVSQLYDLAGNSQVPAPQQQALLLQAHDLRGDLVTLVATQFTKSTTAYTTVMDNLSKVTDGLNQAQQDITNIISVVSGLGDLAKSIDALLKEAAQLGTLA